MDQREVDAVARPLFSGWVTQGPEVAAFEKEFGDYVGAKYSCAVSSCTTALHLALLALGIELGDEVITVSHSFIATANAIRYCGAIPVFVDIDPKTFNLDPALIERVINPKTRAILCVHQMGMPCNLELILEIAGRNHLPVIEDAACAIGSEILWKGNWEKIGKPRGDIACFSFHPRKLVTTGDGGMLTTGRDDFDRLFRLWRQHGMTVPDTVRHGSKEVVFESYTKKGYNYRLTDIQAAVGREQLKKLPEILDRRRYLARRYTELLGRIEGVCTPAEPDWARSNWQSYCVGLPEGCDQRRVMQFLLDRGISTRRGIMCSHVEPAYTSEPWSCGMGPGACGCPTGSCRRLFHSEHEQNNSIILPLFVQMSDEDQDSVVRSLRNALQPASAGILH